MGDVMARILADCLVGMPLMRELNLRDNRLTDKGLMPIVKVHRAPLGDRHCTNDAETSMILRSKNVHKTALYRHRIHRSVHTRVTCYAVEDITEFL